MSKLSNQALIVSKESTFHKVEKFVIRLPYGMRSKIQSVATKARRSMNKEMIARLEHSLANFSNVPLENVSGKDRLLDGSKESEYVQNNFVNNQDQLLHDAIIDIKLKEKITALTSDKKIALIRIL
jgi:hypothetical protein